MSQEAIHALGLLDEARRRKIYRTYDLPHSVDITPRLISGLETCKESFIEAVGPRTFQNSINDCNDNDSFYHEGSRTIPSDYTKPGKPNEFERVAVILPPYVDRRLAKGALIAAVDTITGEESRRKRMGSIYADHPLFVAQTVLHEMGHIEYQDIHHDKLKKWGLTADQLNPTWRRTTESSSNNRRISLSATEAFGDSIGIMTLVNLGQLDKPGFEKMITQLIDSRQQSHFRIITSEEVKAQDFAHDTSKSLLILKQIGYDAIKALPPRDISDASMLIATVGTLQRFGFGFHSPLPRFDASDGAVKVLRDAGIAVPRGFLGDEQAPGPKHGQTGKPPTLADLMNITSHPPEARTRPASKPVSLEQGVSLDWSAVGTSAPKSLQFGVNPAWMRQREPIPASPSAPEQPKQAAPH